MVKGWVRRHLRRKPKGGKTVVKGHTRYSEGQEERLWYHPKGHLSGWNKNLSQVEREVLLEKEVRKRGGDYEAKLSVARALQALANVTEDRETRIKAQSDANVLYRELRQERKRKGK